MSLTIKLHITNHLNLKLGTIKKSSYTNYNTKIRHKPIYHSNPLISTVYKPTMHVVGSSSSSCSIKSSLIDPDGGALVDLVVPESERGKKRSEAQAMGACDQRGVGEPVERVHEGERVFTNFAFQLLASERWVRGEHVASHCSGY